MEYSDRIGEAFQKICPEGSLFLTHYTILKSINGRCFGSEKKPYHYNISLSTPYPGIKRVRVYPLTSKKSEKIPKGYYLIKKGRIPQLGDERDSLIALFIKINVAVEDLLNGELSELKGRIPEDLLKELKNVIKKK